jgi:drug/metabolite transporter (DMT)-like permease
MATAVAAVSVAGERPSAFFWALSALGAALVIAFALQDGAIVPLLGDLYLFAAVAICGMGYALSGSLARRMPGWEVISWAVVITLPALVPATVLLWPADAGAVALPSWAGLVYVALVSQYFGFFLWNSALAIGGVARIGQIQLLQPFATLAIAAAMLGEPIGIRTILFATAVVVVVGAGLRARIGVRSAVSIAPAARTIGTGRS